MSDLTDADSALAEAIAAWLREREESPRPNWVAVMQAIDHLRDLGMRPCDVDALAQQEDRALRDLLKAINPTEAEAAGALLTAQGRVGTSNRTMASGLMTDAATVEAASRAWAAEDAAAQPLSDADLQGLIEYFTGWAPSEGTVIERWGPVQTAQFRSDVRRALTEYRALRQAQNSQDREAGDPTAVQLAMRPEGAVLRRRLHAAEASLAALRRQVLRLLEATDEAVKHMDAYRIGWEDDSVSETSMIDIRHALALAIDHCRDVSHETRALLLASDATVTPPEKS